jgi:hypothetical protein
LPCSYQTTYQEEYIGAIKCYDISTPENAISGGDYSGSPKQNAFDKTNSSTTWASSQIYTGVSGVAYIGQRVDSKIKKIRHLNCNQDSGNISSVLVNGLLTD